MQVRNIEEKDLAPIQEQIALDPVHSQDENFKPEIFRDTRLLGSIVAEDSQGPVMYASFSREIRVTIQFCDVDARRVREVFNHYIPKFAKEFQNKGFTGMTYVAGIGDTGTKPTLISRALTMFLTTFGFRKEIVQRKPL
jgi:hypothetical protein